MTDMTEQPNRNGIEQAGVAPPSAINPAVSGDAPAVALGNLYQATAQALANAAHNATNSQQQSYVTAQAATTMGVSTLLSIDTASTGVATQHILSAKVEPPEAMRAQVEGAVAALQGALPSSAARAAVQGYEDFALAMRKVAGAFAESLDQLNRTAYAQSLQTIKLAATSACLAAMIKAPDHAKGYEHVLEVIKALE
jgi:killing trait domain-containing protein